MRKSVQVKGVAVLVLLVVALCIWYAAIREDRRGLLEVSFLNIGQGDAIFIQAPSGRQALIDGGPDTSVLRELSRILPWYDRSIDVVIPTHPDADHISGLVDVLARYDVAYIIHSDVEGDTATASALVRSMAREGAQQIVAKRGQIIDLGDGAYLEILFPDRSVAHVETNTGCVVARLVYGTTAFMLSCDAPKEIENYLVQLASTPLDSARDKPPGASDSSLKADVLKAGHHGSKNSSAPLFLGYVAPSFGVFSRGCDNRYGHPAQEVVQRFEQFGIPAADTCKEGTITFVSDGRTVRRD